MTITWSNQFVVYLFISLVVIFSAVMMLFSRKVMHMALSIGGVFIGVAGVYILLDAEFVAFAQVLIYAGAITILMLFAIMLTQHNTQEDPSQNPWHYGISIATSVALLAILFWVFRSTTWPQAPAHPPWQDQSVEAIAGGIFGQYVVPFEVVSVVLIVALVGAVVLARKEEE